MGKAQAQSIIALTIIVLAAALIGCGSPPAQGNNTQYGVTVTGTYTPPQTFDPGADLRPRAFGSEDELRGFLTQSNAQGGIGGWGGFAKGALMNAEAADAAVPSVAGGASRQFSETNNQVAGVDEADILKTDGEYIYTVTGNTLFIVKAGEEASVVETIELEHQPQGLFVDGDRLAVFGYFYDLDYFKRIDLVPQSGMTYFTIYDISDRAEPKVVKEYKFEGTYFQARMRESDVYFVVMSGAQVRDEPTPIIMDGENVRHVAVSDVRYYPMPYSSVQFATVHAIDLQTPGDVDSTTLTVEWSNTLYMSEQNLYIASTKQINEWEIAQEVTMELLEGRLAESDARLIQKIKEADDQVLSQAEKRAKIYEIYSRYVQYMNSSEQQDFQDRVEEETKERLDKYEALTYTVISRISAQDGQVELAATGEVPGSLHNQFAMDEYDGVLRVATTIQPGMWWGRPIPVDIGGGNVRATETATVEPGVAIEAIAPDEPAARKIMPPRERGESTNNVYTLDSGMKVIGKLTDLAEGEQIYSTRFIGERLYMVTFRQIDPFFVIDLSDPASPKDLGELKIPGFSRYLHPYDENTIIGIGREATENGRQQGLKISLFDVTDATKPREIAKFVTSDDYAQSAAEYEHKAFLFDREKELLVIPAYSYDYDYRGGSRQSYNGAMVFRIAREEIAMRGIIDHSQGSQQWGPTVERSLWIDELLYTKSPNLLRVNRISDLGTVTNVTLTSKSGGPYPVY